MKKFFIQLISPILILTLMIINVKFAYSSQDENASNKLNLNVNNGIEALSSPNLNYLKIDKIINNIDKKFLDTIPQPKYLKCNFINTGNNSTLFIVLDTNDKINMWEIGVWDTTGLLIGAAVVTSDTVGITVWGDNSQTDTIDGALEGEPLKVKILNINNMSLINIMFKSLKDFMSGAQLSSYTYHANQFVIANADQITDVIENSDFKLNLITSPNPVKNNLKIDFSLPSDCLVSLKIYDLNGREAASILDKYMIAGDYTEYFNAENLKDGVYFLTLNCNGIEKVLKIIK